MRQGGRRGLPDPAAAVVHRNVLLCDHIQLLQSVRVLGVGDVANVLRSGVGDGGVRRPLVGLQAPPSPCWQARPARRRGPHTSKTSSASMGSRPSSPTAARAAWVQAGAGSAPTTCQADGGPMRQAGK